MPDFNFAPQTNPMQGVSMADLVAARQSPLTTIAQSGAPILEALRRRQEMMKRQAAIDAIAQGFSGQPDAAQVLSRPDVIGPALKTGLVSLEDLGKLQTSAAENARKKELDKSSIELKNQQAEQIKWAMSKNLIPVTQPDGSIRFVPIPQGGNPTASTHPPTEGDPLKAAIADMLKNGNTEALKKLAAQGKAAPAGLAAPAQAGAAPQAPAGFETVRNTKTGQYGFKNKKTGQILPVK